jgi:hypothetical protein
MRRLFALALVLPVQLLPTEVFAEAKINVRIEFSTYRVRPNPGPASSHVDFVVGLKDDGSVSQEYQETGQYARHTSSDSRLGQGMRVTDANTLTRTIDFKDRVNVLTIKVSGKTCHATLTNTLKPGFDSFEANSSHFGGAAFYRDWRQTSSTCSIR